MSPSQRRTPDPAASAGDETHAGFVRRPIRRFRAGKIAQLTDAIAEEVPIALVYNDRPHVVMMATPRDLDDFALGFSLSEAVIARADELTSIESQTLLEGIEIRLRIPEARAEALESRHRNLTGRTSCGLCGAQALEDAVRQPPAVGAGPTIERGDPASDARAIARSAAAQRRDRRDARGCVGASRRRGRAAARRRRPPQRARQTDRRDGQGG